MQKYQEQILSNLEGKVVEKSKFAKETEPRWIVYELSMTSLKHQVSSK